MPEKTSDLNNDKSVVERNLESAVFGDEDFYDRFGEDTDDEREFEQQKEISDAIGKDTPYDILEDEQLFVIDDGSDPKASSLKDALHKDSDVEMDGDVEQNERPAAWQDSDDEKLSISLASVPRLRKLRRTDEEDRVSGTEYVRRLRAQFERVYPVPDWALPVQRRNRKRRTHPDDSGTGSDSDSPMDDQVIALSADPLKALFRSSQSYVKSSKSAVRPPGRIEIKRLRDANHQAPAHSAIQTMSFHPTFPLVMAGGYDRTLRVYHIDGKLNTPATSLYLKNVPIETAQFHPDGKRVFIGSKRKYFHIWDLESGHVEKISRMYGHEGMQTNMEKFALSRSGELLALAGSSGWVNILSANTGQWIDAFKITRAVSDLVWHHNGNLTVANIGAELWEYNPSDKEIIRRWADEGGLSTTKIALGGRNDRWIAVGSKSGIVNIYDRLQEGENLRKPHKTMQQITTAIHDLQFSADGQILAMTSRAKKDVLRLVHLPTATVFQNWPTQSTPLGKVGAVAFSPGSEMLCIGNEAGRVTLWSL